MPKVAILGSTGSIGTNTLDVIDRLEPDFTVISLSAGRNIQLLAEQINQYQPEIVSVTNEVVAAELQSMLKRKKLPKIVYGIEGMIEVATHPEADIVVSATVGAVGLQPTYKAIELGRRVAIANKEPLVMAGELMQKQARISGAEILPVDSEHNALHQCLRGEQTKEVRRLILTASGGPFRNSSRQELEQVSVSDALKHPTWQMGTKITIDSATMMNKGLEVIEAHWLFNFDSDEIDIIIHPQSVVHSMVEFVDGSIIAQMGKTDMRLPIQYALTYPDRLPLHLPRLDLAALQKLEFFAPDREKFPAIELSYRALKLGGVAPAVLNASNEVAVAAFLAEKIKFLDIARVIESQLNRIAKNGVKAVESLEEVLQADLKAREDATEFIKNISSVGASANF